MEGGGAAGVGGTRVDTNVQDEEVHYIHKFDRNKMYECEVEQDRRRCVCQSVAIQTRGECPLSTAPLKNYSKSQNG